MNLGRYTYVLALTCALAFALAGCGGDDAATNASGTPTAEAGATGATGKASKKEKDSKESSKSSSKSSSDSKESGSSEKSPGFKTETPDGGSVEASPGSKIGPEPVNLSGANKKAVTKSFNDLIAALDSKNVAYLCGSAYAKDYLALMAKQGGCVKVTEKQLSSITGYSASITSISAVPGTKLVSVNAKLKPATSSGSKSNEGAIYFVKQSGKWKRAVPPSA